MPVKISNDLLTWHIEFVHHYEVFIVFAEVTHVVTHGRSKENPEYDPGVHVGINF